MGTKIRGEGRRIRNGRGEQGGRGAGRKLEGRRAGGRERRGETGKSDGNVRKRKAGQKYDGEEEEQGKEER